MGVHRLPLPALPIKTNIVPYRLIVSYKCNLYLSDAIPL